MLALYDEKNLENSLKNKVSRVELADRHTQTDRLTLNFIDIDMTIRSIELFCARVG